MLRKISPLLLIGILCTSGYGAPAGPPYVYQAQFIDALTGKPIAGMTVNETITLSKNEFLSTGVQNGVTTYPTLTKSGVTDANGNLSITFTWQPRDPATGYNGPTDQQPYLYYDLYAFYSTSTPTITSPGFSAVTYVSGNIYTAFLTTPLNNNSVTLTQNAINKLLSGLYRDNDSRFPHNLSGSSNGYSYSINLSAPQITINSGATLAVTIPFSGTASLPASFTGTISFSAQIVCVDINGGYQIRLQFPNDISASLILTGSSSAYQSFFQSTYGSSITVNINVSGFGGYVNLGNPVVSGTFGGLYTEMGLQTPVFTTNQNPSNPGLSTATLYFYDRLSYIGTLQ
jgi:hypothetical protein